MDPVLLHLMRNARSNAVQKEFLRVPAESYTNEHDVKLVVRSLCPPRTTRLRRLCTGLRRTLTP